MAECYTLGLNDDANLFLFPDPNALQDVLEAHARYDDEDEPLVLCATDYATYIDQMEAA